MTARLLKYGVGGVLAAGFFGVFILAGGLRSDSGRKAATPLPTGVIKGDFGPHLYSISNLARQNQKLAQFDPPLPADDAVVVGTLKAVTKDSYGLQIGDEVQPVVETLSELNYVTFSVGKDKILFELFRNSSGQVGTAHFWRETLSN